MSTSGFDEQVHWFADAGGDYCGSMKICGAQSAVALGARKAARIAADPSRWDKLPREGQLRFFETRKR